MNTPDPIRVLLADDHAIVRAGIRQFLEANEDIRVIAETGNGREACELIDRHRPDVAVLDIQMPEMSGIDVARRLRGRKIPVGILVLTAYDDAPYVQAVLQAGANGYVLKTAQPEEIVQGVRDVFQGKTVLDAALASRLIRDLQPRDEPTPFEALTARELEILTLAARGFTNKAIGAQLTISDRTVQNHLANIFGKLHAASRTEAVMRAVAQHLISTDQAQAPGG